MSETLTDVRKPGEFRLLDDSNAMKGLELKYPDGDKCDIDDYYELTILLKCDSTKVDAPTLEVDQTSVLSNKCKPRLIMQTVHGCPINEAGPLHYFMERYQYLLGANCMLVGFGMVGFGGMMPGLTLFLLTMLITGTFQMVIIYDMLLG